MFKSYQVTYERQRILRRAEIAAEIKAAIAMLTITDGYRTFVALNKALSALYDVPNDLSSLNKFWSKVTAI
jgi:hypothetical protein